MQAGQDLADAVMTKRWKTAAANREEMEHQLSAQEREMAKKRREALDDQYRKMSSQKRIALQKKGKRSLPVTVGQSTCRAP